MTMLVDALDIECLVLLALFGLWLRRGGDVASSEALVASQAMAVGYPALAYAGLLTPAVAVACAAVAVILAVPRWQIACAEVLALGAVLVLGLQGPDFPTLLILAAVALAAGWIRVLLDLDRRAAQSTARGVAQARTRERERIVRTLHDSIGQELAALRLTLDVLGERPGVTTDQTAQALLGRSQALVDQAYSDLRAVIHGNTASTLSVEVEAQRASAVLAAVEVRAQVPPLGSLPPQVDQALAQALRELGTNALRHAGATTVTVTVTHDQDTARMTVADDGRGLDTSRLRADHGLEMTRREIARLGGSMSIDSGGGTSVTIELPLAPAAERVEPWGAPAAGEGTA